MHSTSDSSELKPKSENTVVLVGAPNSGKTTLYNWLTGSRFKTVNYPGSTVEYSMGPLAAHFGADLFMIDTPGTYSLYPKSGDEEVTRAVLEENPAFQESTQKVICVVDGTQLKRHLPLVLQLKKSGFSVVLAVTMMDLLRKAQLKLNLEVLSQEMGLPVVGIEGLLGGGIPELIGKIREVPSSVGGVAIPDESSVKISGEDVLPMIHRAFQGRENQVRSVYDQTEKWDRVFLHPVAGVFIFVLLMFLVFSSIFWVAAPLMEIVDGAFTFLVDGIMEAGSGSLLADFLGKGALASLGAVMVFVPQIFILFMGIGILESSGYLARAATLIDQPFSKIGMSGRSFVPILSGFACAVPAIMATRNMSSARDRWITNFIIPFMTCSARLPVYALLLSFLYREQPAWKAGLALTSLYFLALFLGAAAAAILNRMLKKDRGSVFMMELPMYRRPLWRSLLSQTLGRTKAYIQRAGPPIFIFSVLIWVGTTFPHIHESEPQVQLQNSYLGQMGRWIEPIFTPMGGDWRTGVGLMTAFAARETFVSSMAVLFQITESGDGGQIASLLKAMSQAQAPSGGLLFTFSSIVGLIAFFAIAMQCLSTFAIVGREMGSWRFAWIQILTMNVLAYVISVALVQGLRALGIA